MDEDLRGRTAWVTRAAPGIGKANTLLYGQHGANVMGLDVDQTQDHGLNRLGYRC